MKTVLLTSAAALLMAGAANAAEVRVVQEPGSMVNVTVADYGALTPSAPLTGSFDGDLQGMSSADFVSPTGTLPPGFNPDTFIYIWADENRTSNSPMVFRID